MHEYDECSTTALHLVEVDVLADAGHYWGVDISCNRDGSQSRKRQTDEGGQPELSARNFHVAECRFFGKFQTNRQASVAESSALLELQHAVHIL